MTVRLVTRHNRWCAAPNFYFVAAYLMYLVSSIVLKLTPTNILPSGDPNMGPNPTCFDNAPSNRSLLKKLLKYIHTHTISTIY